MTSLFITANILVLLIGIFMIGKYSGQGWVTPPTLSGLAFILISLPVVLTLFL